MLTEEQAIALGKRAMAAGWKWQPGAVDMHGCRCVAVDASGPRGVPVNPEHDIWFFRDDIPDFRDPATLGILLAQVREVWKGPGIFTVDHFARNGSGSWGVYSYQFLVRSTPRRKYPTEAEALVAALEAMNADA